MMTVKELYEKVVNGIIISDIELQRAIVYDAEKQALVIDSIYRGIPLPAFYLWEREDGVLEVLDGKQRIEAIITCEDKAKMLSNLVLDGDGRFECNECHQHFTADELTMHHIKAWSKGGRTVLSNAQLLCRACNSRKGNR